ncbi:class I SAM-dependent methyltransferase [Dactylosporangium sp. NPDC000521]|uniref:class I SAM-dependent methyltransferase n=1 Tax=Dactylosporangium sp. NPDC000521 TaxID=3363975 RepID=UPI00369C0937
MATLPSPPPPPPGPQLPPPAPQPPSGTNPEQRRAIAESFGVDAGRYDRTRPAYPEALIARIAATAPGPDTLDVGCGTGIASRQLQAAGRTVLGVEPDPRMAAFARTTGVDVEVSTFESWNPAGRSFDAVVAATAWHWVDTPAGTAKAAEVLRPGGLLAAFWHTWELPPTVAATFADIYHRVLPDAPFTIQPSVQGVALYRPMFTQAADGIRATGAFTEPEEWTFPWEHAYTTATWLDQLPTTGALTRVPEDRLTEILDRVGTAIDHLGGTFTLPYTTVAVTALRQVH